MDVKWIKLSTEIFLNSKITMLRGEKNGERLLLIWIMLLVLAGRCNRGGRLMLTDDIIYNTKTLSKELGFSEKMLELAFEQFVRLNMIIVEDGAYIIKNWERYQSAESLEKLREANKIRNREYRQRKRDITRDITVTSHDATEEEREEDKEKEIEFHSINLSRERDDEFVEKSVENQKRSYLKGTLGQGVVLLSDEQFDDLLDKLSLAEFDKYVGIVRDNELAGKHYKRKTHYQAVIDMATADRRLV